MAFIDQWQIDELKAKIKRLENLQAGNGIRIDRGAGGTIISATPQIIQSQNRTATPAVSPGGIVELHQEWVDTIYSWRLNERVVYKPVEVVPYPEWSAATVYSIGNQVKYLGRPYTALVDSINVIPNSDPTHWQQPPLEFYLVYQCNDASATNTDIPGTSAKWTKITVWTDEPYWSRTTAYTTGQKVLYLGAIYTAAADSMGVEPGTNAGKWISGSWTNEPNWVSTTAYTTGQKVLHLSGVYVAVVESTGIEPGTNIDIWFPDVHSLIGIKSYPMQVGGVDVYTPYAEYYQTGMRYDLTPDADTNKLYFSQRRITRYLDGKVRIDPVSDLIEWAPSIDHDA